MAAFQSVCGWLFPSLLHVCTSKDTGNMLLLFDLTCAVFLISTLGSQTVLVRDSLSTPHESLGFTLFRLLIAFTSHSLFSKRLKLFSPVGRDAGRNSAIIFLHETSCGKWVGCLCM